MNGPALLALQLLDIELDSLDSTAKRLPERAALDEHLARHRELVTRRDGHRRAAEEAADRIAAAERDAAALTTKRTRLEAQLKTVIAPREAEALMREIEGLTAQRSELDDAELEAMELQAEAEGAVDALDDQEPALLAAVEAARAALDVAVGTIAAQREQVGAARTDALAALSADEVAVYDRLRREFGGVGIVRLEGRRCSGCHLDLSAAEADTVKAAPADELPECPHCGRLIVR